MVRPSKTHLHRMLHRVLRVVHTVVTPGRFVPPNPAVAVSDDDLHQTKREDAVTAATPQRGTSPPRLWRDQH